MLSTALLLASLFLPAQGDSIAPRSLVLWTPEAFSTMSFLYQRITAIPGGVEFAACLRAQREGNAWIVTEVVIPAQSGNSPTGIEKAECPGFEGIAHSHPLWEDRRACFPSFNDRLAFAGSSNDFFVIWCDVEAFTFRTRDRGIGGKDDTEPDPARISSPEPHLWRHPLGDPARAAADPRIAMPRGD